MNSEGTLSFKLIIICFLLASYSSFSQKTTPRQKIDSLVQSLERVQSDTSNVKVLIDISNIYYSISRDTSKIYAQKAAKYALKRLDKLPYSKKDRLIELLETCYANIGIADYRNGDYLSAESYYLKCIDLKTKYNHDGKPHMYNQLAACATDMFDFARALDYAFESLEWTEKIEEPTRPDMTVKSISYNVISNIYRKLDDWEKCNEYTLKGLKFAEE